MTTVAHPDPSEYAPEFGRYLANVPEPDILAAIEAQSVATQQLLASLDETKAAHRYAPDKWSIKQVLGHLGDGERVFGYRALAIARGQTESLPGWDENEFVDTAAFDAWSLSDLVEQLALLRRANLVLFRNLPAEAWTRRGVANRYTATPRAIAAGLVGHERHHLKVLRERYGI